ncbi:MAG: cupin domain-containing protein [Lysobacterales bacterium]
MSELTDCLLTSEPKVLGFPEGINHPTDSVTWALEMFAANFPEADVQSRESHSGKQDSKLTFFDQKDPAGYERFKQRVRNAQPVHGSLPLIDYCAGDGTVRDNADWTREIYEKEFAQGLAERHPTGSYLRATLWTSCGDHRYEAHCDLFDGFLLHMGGYKRVRVWPVPPKYRQRVIFNHRDFKGRMASEPIDFELEPGQILYIPSGAMHEVIAHGEQAAVSVSFHMGSPFPILTLCAQLNRMVQGGKISVPPYMKKIDKFNLFFFEPTRFIDKDRSLDDGMPDRLLKELSGVLQSKQVYLKTMRRMLSNWWRLAMSRPMYQGPYPERV